MLYNHTIRVGIWTKLEVLRRKNIVCLTGFRAYFSSCIQRADKWVGTIDQLPPSTVWSNIPHD